MDNDKLKQMFPFLKNVDLDDPRQKKHLGAVLVILAMGILVLVLALMSAAKKKEAQTPPVEAVSTERQDTVQPRKTGRKVELLEIPAAENTNEDEVLASPNMISARERQRNSRGSRLKDLYGQAEYGDDPMAEPEEKDDYGAGGSTPANLDQIKKLYGTADSQEPEEEETQDPQPASPKKKTINRGGEPMSTTTHGMAQYPSDPAVRPSDPPSKVTVPAVREDYEGAPSTVTAVQSSPDSVSVAVAPKTVRKSGGISSLDDWGSVDGIGGLDDEEQYVTVDADKPVKVMFVREQKITSGQRVFLRLLDDIAADGILIPKNTHLSAQCSIGDRLQIKVNNIEINGKIINLGYTAYDNDGNEGLHCPESSSRQQVKQGTNNAMNIGQSLLQSRISGIAGQVISSGSSITRSSTGKVTAQVNAGYTFFLLKDDF